MFNLTRRALLLFASALSCHVQDAPYTLHVYEDQVQLPVLVLDKSHSSKLGLNPLDFYLKLDSGPSFHPTHLHMAADEPLSVTLLLDTSSNTQTTMLQSLQQQAAFLPFGPHDRLTVLAFDCVLIRTAHDLPASPAILQQAIARVFANPNLHSATCNPPVALWDAVYDAASLTGALPGRRILLIVSAGQDSYRQNTRAWETVRRYAGSLGFTIFGIRNPQSGEATLEDPFNLLCGGTGGFTISLTPDALGANLQHLFALIRTRYTLEFPRPANGTSGFHHLDVTVKDPKLLVRASGVSYQVLDNATLPDPTLTPDATQRPIVGSRKPMDPK